MKTILVILLLVFLFWIIFKPNTNEALQSIPVFRKIKQLTTSNNN